MIEHVVHSGELLAENFDQRMTEGKADAGRGAHPAR
jgi:hypothetical protein